MLEIDDGVEEEVEDDAVDVEDWEKVEEDISLVEEDTELVSEAVNDERVVKEA
jgi:hypothetical protein